MAWLEVSLILGFIAASLAFSWYWSRLMAARVGDAVGFVLRSMDERYTNAVGNAGAPEAPNDHPQTERERLLREYFTEFKPDVEKIVVVVNSSRSVDIRLAYRSRYFSELARAVESIFARRGYGRRYSLEEKDKHILYAALKHGIRDALDSIGR